MHGMDLWLIDLEVKNRNLSQDDVNENGMKTRKALNRFNEHYTWAKNLTDSPNMHMEASSIQTQVILMISRKAPAESIERYLDQALPKLSECVENYRSNNREFTHLQNNHNQLIINTQNTICNATTESSRFVYQKRNTNSTRELSMQKLNIEEKKSSSLCKRPLFSDALDAYNKVKSIIDLSEITGGKLKQNFDGKSFINGCASRISFVMEQTGCKIPVIPKKTVSGKNGEQYIFRLSTLDPFLRKAYGPPDCEWRNWSVISKSNEERCTSLKGRQGILIERWKPHPHSTCTGHAKLIDGTNSDSFPPEDGQFWELPNDGQIPNKKEQKEPDFGLTPSDPFF